MNCLLLSRYGPLGASSRVRSYQYLSYLKTHGVEVTVAPLMGDDYVRDLYSGRGRNWPSIGKAYLKRVVVILKSGQFDLLWIEKELWPWFPAWAERTLNWLRIPYVVDYDDAVFHRYDLSRNPVSRLVLRHKIDVVMRNASLVVVGNNYLAEKAESSRAQRVEILPSVIDLQKFPKDVQQHGKDFTIGWIGTPVTSPYLLLIQQALEELSIPGGFRLVVVGAGRAALRRIPIEHWDWSEDTEVSSIQRFDVGIMPLPDDLWAQGKCGYKLIQYMACGLPVVASPVGANRQIVEHGINGFFASSTSQWVECLAQLGLNSELRLAMGRAGRKKVETRYCLQVTAPKLLSFLLDAAFTRTVSN
jgi:glycosyltransferase involved in cell wall biosynthesis